ncbi:MAG: sulfur carrier protein ThiS [Flavobacteriales bacterium]|jgi:sulfur carrier protein|tara:strand:- start:6830 stop:7033 length:204 start_codon:yes stop_codon:yes gene_type:complete
MVSVLVNENPIEIEENATLSQLLQKVNTSVEGIAIAINDEIITKNAWESQAIKNNDNVLIIKATQGG